MITLADVRAEETVQAQIQAALAQLTHAETHARLQAINTLGRLKDPLSTSALIQFLKSKNQEDVVRQQAVYALSHRRDPAILPLFAQLQKEGGVPLRQTIVGAVGQFGPEGAPALMLALNDPEPSIRSQAVWSLSAMSLATLSHLMNALEDRDVNVRNAAVGALGQLKTPAIPLLKKVIDHSQESVMVRRTALSVLGQMKVPEAIALVSRVMANDPDAAMREHAVSALAQQGLEALPKLMEAAQDPEVNVRHTAAQMLGQAGPPAAPAVPVLMNMAAHDQDPVVRQQAAWALGRIQDPAATPTLVLAMGDPDTGVCMEAGLALLQLTQFARPALAQALHHPQVKVRQMAVQMLAQLNDPLAFPDLLIALRDPEPWVRQEAAKALGNSNNPAAMPALTATLRDPHPAVYTHARLALQAIKKGGEGKEGKEEQAK